MTHRVRLSTKTLDLLRDMSPWDAAALLGTDLDARRIPGSETWEVRCSLEFLNAVAAEQLPTETFDEALRRTLAPGVPT